ncbi:KTSC domain-containing protein [Roseateles sp. L2-2]|uniref:KTSC domain-containing protein n=1 Tax=Roseateles sp. L2-2 TaxID=3422597 RepID=UPI003D3692A4
MQRTSVSSSNLASAGYDPTTQTLEVEFNSGGIYEYYNVPEHLFHELLSASSVGRYFAQHIKNTFGYAQVG